MSGDGRAIPILMLHSVAPEGALAPHGWLERLSVPPDVVDATFAMWRRAGYRTLSLDDAAAYVKRGNSVPKRCVVLTLDDGYVDNWIGLHPLLKAHDMCATVFVSSDYVDPRPLLRPQANGRAASAPVDWLGYLSWDEMRAMEASGHTRIESHARTHTWYFVSDRIVDFYRPQTPIRARSSLLRFLWLNRFPDRKAYMLSEMDDASVPWGTPIYEFAPSLVARRFTPRPEETEAIIGEVESGGGAAFFERADWKRRLEELVRGLRTGRADAGTWESAAEHERRVRDELATSRALLSRGLGRDVRFLSCPQGAMDDLVERVAGEVGYEAWTKSAFTEGRLNRAGGPSRHLYRCGTGLDLFGSAAHPSLRVLSQRIVLERYSGARWAHAATATLSAASRLVARRDDGPAPS